jgi:hypothetical protein
MGQLSSAISFSGLPSRVDEDRESTAELLSLFSDELFPLLRTVREAVVQADLKPLSQARSSFVVLEQLGRNSQSEGLAAALTALRQDSEKVAASIRLYLEESPAWEC